MFLLLFPYIFLLLLPADVRVSVQCSSYNIYNNSKAVLLNENCINYSKLDEHELTQKHILLTIVWSCADGLVGRKTEKRNTALNSWWRFSTISRFFCSALSLCVSIFPSLECIMNLTWSNSLWREKKLLNFFPASPFRPTSSKKRLFVKNINECISAFCFSHVKFSVLSLVQ